MYEGGKIDVKDAISFSEQRVVDLQKLLNKYKKK
jgi:hypothetical protein